MYEQATYFVPKIQNQKLVRPARLEVHMKRNHEIKIRFNDDEFKILNNKLERTSLSREAFSRACILGKEIKVPPDLEYYKLKNEFNHIGNNLNQIARALNNRQDISLKTIMETIKELRQMIKNLDEKVRG